MATPTTVDTMMPVAKLVTMCAPTKARAPGADADHADDDDGVPASAMEVWETARHARAVDARVALM
eukprot:1329780-Pyramimonas_sp.AAC.1